MALFFARLRPFLFKNTTDSQTVAKNTVWLSVSNFGGRLLKAAVIIYAARILDPAGLGIFSYAVTLAGFLTFFVDPGLNVLLIRAGAKEGEDYRIKLVSTTLYIKLALVACAVLFVLLAGPFFSTLPGAKALLPIVALIIIGDTLREFFSSLMLAKEKMERGAVVFLFTNLAIVIAGSTALFLWPSALVFGWAYAIGTTLGALAAAWVARPYVTKIFSSFTPELLKSIFNSAWPFAVTGTLGILLTNTDILILSWLRSASDVGIYSAVVRIIQVLYLFPVILQYSTLPLLSRLAHADAKRFRETFERILGIIFMVSIPLALGGIILSMQIIHTLYGAAYAAGATSLMLLMVSTLVDYPGGVISLAVFAYDRQKILINASIIGGIANIAFDLLLIPHFGIVGSAMATLLAQVLNNSYLWYAMKKINRFAVLPKLKKITAAALGMAAVTVLLLILHTGLVLTIVLSMAAYAGLLLLLREPLVRAVMKIFTAVEHNIEETAAEDTRAKAVGASVQIGAHTIAVEIAKSPEAIRVGLSGRSMLPQGKGMLFVFPKPKRYRFWMKDMLFPIDIIWIRGGAVVGFDQNVVDDFDPKAPRFYQAPEPADYVLEVPSGFVKEKGIRAGDPVVLASVRPAFTILPAVEADRYAWNQFLLDNYLPVGLFLGTWEWGEFQKKLGRRTEHYFIKEKDVTVAVFTFIRYPLPCGMSYGYLPRGPIIAKEYREGETKHFKILAALQKWAQDKLPPLVFLRMEPPLYALPENSGTYGMHQPSYSVQPPHNTVVSLAATEADILARFHSSTRSNIKRAQRRGVTFEMKKRLTEDDFQHFFAMIQSTTARNNGKNAYPSQEYLRTFLSTNVLTGTGDTHEPALFSLGFFCGYQNGKPAAAHVVVFFGGTATYLFGASYAHCLQSKVDTYLHWVAMQEAMRRGMRHYDIGGIDERIWPSLTAFKRQFGGEEFTYIGNLDVPLRPWAYHAYNFFKKSLKKMRTQA